MYVCVCNAITESELIKEAIQCPSAQHLIAKTGASGCCGQCQEMVEDIYNRSMPNNSQIPIPYKIFQTFS